MVGREAKDRSCGFLAAESSNRVIKPLHFSYDSVIPSPTSAKSDDEAVHGAIARRTGIDRKAVRNLLDRDLMAQPKVRGTTTNNEDVVPERYA